MKSNTTNLCFCDISMESIAERLKYARKEASITQVELGERMGWESGQRRVSQYESGRSVPSYSDMVKIAKYLGVNAAWLAFGGDNAMRGINKAVQNEAVFMETDIEPWDSETPLENDEVAVPFFTEVEAAAGNGNVVHIENHGPKLRFSKSTLKRAGVEPEAAVCIKVSGNSMEPVIPDGAVIGVDTSNTRVKDGDMYAIQQGDMLRVKVVYRLPNAYRLKSFNDSEWPIEMVEGDAAKELKVIGRVFWYSVLR